MAEIRFKTVDEVLLVLINEVPDTELKFNIRAWREAKNLHSITPEVLGLIKQRIKWLIRDTPGLTPEQQQQIVTRFFEEMDG
jgi:hypothetical protein